MSRVIPRQRLLFALCALAALLVGVELWMTIAIAGDTGAILVPSDAPFIEKIASIDPASPATAAGVQVGDTIDLRDLSPADRYRIPNGFPAGRRIVLPVVHDGVRRTVALTPRPLTQGRFWRDDGWDQVLSVVGEFWNVLVAALIVWRRRDRPEALILALALVLFPLGVAMTPSNFWQTPWPPLDAVANVLGTALSSTAAALVAAYALCFGHPVSRVRWTATWLTYVAVFFSIIVYAAGIAGQWLGTIDSASWFFARTGPTLALDIVPFVLPYVCVILALPAARDRERTRLGWASGAFAFLSASSIFFSVALQLDVLVHVATVVVDVAVFVTPLILTYALLGNRLLDVGFVLNRAVVVALLSSCGVAAFVIIEWIVSPFFGHLGTTGVLVVNIVAAIMLGLLAPALYRRSEAMIERVFFRRQYRARERVERLAAGLPYVESAAIIAAALTRDLCKILELPSSALYRRSADGTYVCDAAVGWDDGARLAQSDVARLVLQLTANRSPLRIGDDDLDAPQHDGRDSLPAIVFPLESRQELTGFVAYSAHAGGIDIDPDERSLLAEAARQASRGYDAIELATRVELAYRARMDAEAETKETLRRSNLVLERLNEAQARFVPTEFLHFLRRDSIVDVVLGDSTLHTMSVLFSDIRSFSTIAEAMAPPEIFAFLNEYMRRIGPLVREHNGFIDKYIGDAVMGLFPETAADALRAAVALQRELRIYNAQLERERKPHVAAGVGVHTGQLIIGTIGERARMDTTVISDAVNAAARLESATKTFGCSILISRQTYDALADPGEFLLRRLGNTRVKGKTVSLDVYECFSGDAPAAAERKLRCAGTFAAAVSAFEDGRAADAAADFARIVSADPGDGPAQYYLQRCQQPAEATAPE